MLELLQAKGASLDQGGVTMPKEWVAVGEERASHDGNIVAKGGEWREFVIFGEKCGAPPDPDIPRYLTKTTEVLEHLLPGAVAMANLGAGEIIFSALAPGTKLNTHCAAGNVRLTCHLGLFCPEGARIRCGPEWGQWEEGKCIFFDDSYEHEVENTGKGVRVVLLIRFWHPDVKSEHEYIPLLEEGMQDYERLFRRRSTPPMNEVVAQLINEPMQKIMAELGVGPGPSMDPMTLAKSEAADLALGAQ
eukprot:gnl/TRDRNA2_/TRDRNA2_169113_c2_seq2.p1 gnl/TRDRNA2_/TRDRNA2_169113_c2~~gnl/TRDRNA2_/TRDRNA2_169113_c2_seq2.p1  ORF type:complete len:247 (-),score=54.01 gnl/TRDRNA2_/TRDRNA2_169113_c2_seq2:38-778(-)